MPSSEVSREILGRETGEYPDAFSPRGLAVGGEVHASAVAALGVFDWRIDRTASTRPAGVVALTGGDDVDEVPLCPSLKSATDVGRAALSRKRRSSCRLS
jgi:hypothetical protein